MATQLQPITKPEQMKAIHDGLVSEGGCLLYPTHVVETDGELIGAVSIGGIPTLHWWFSTKNGNALRSVRAISKSEEIMWGAGIRQYQTIIPTHSPFTPVLNRLGFIKPFEDTATLYIKNLGGQ